MKLNGIDVKTVVSEERIGTRDSIVCGRYEVDDEPVYYLGEVRHIVSWRETVLLQLCVEWFDVVAYRILTGPGFRSRCCCPPVW